MRAWLRKLQFVSYEEHQIKNLKTRRDFFAKETSHSATVVTRLLDISWRKLDPYTLSLHSHKD